MPRSSKGNAAFGRRFFFCAAAIIAAICATAALAAEWSPPAEPLEVRTLGDEMRAFPRDVAVPRAIFVVTYSKAATTAAANWTKRLREIKPKWDVHLYQLAVLDDIPGLFRGAVITAMAAGVPEAMRDRFWVAELHGRQWRSFTDSEADDVPHVVVLDQRRRVAWRTSGPASEEKLKELAALPPPAWQ